MLVQLEFELRKLLRGIRYDGIRYILSLIKIEFFEQKNDPFPKKSEWKNCEKFPQVALSILIRSIYSRKVSILITSVNLFSLLLCCVVAIKIHKKNSILTFSHTGFIMSVVGVLHRYSALHDTCFCE